MVCRMLKTFHGMIYTSVTNFYNDNIFNYSAHPKIANFPMLSPSDKSPVHSYQSAACLHRFRVASAEQGRRPPKHCEGGCRLAKPINLLHSSTLHMYAPQPTNQPSLIFTANPP